MADPFTILGTASSIITLLEFSWKLLADTRTIYKSTTGDNEDIAILLVIAEDVNRLGNAITVSPGCGDDLKTLVDLAHGIARDLVEALDKLKVQGTKTVWKSFMVALKDVWRNGQIEAFSHRLAKLQTQIASHIQLLILNTVSQISRQMENTNNVLGATIRTEFHKMREDVLNAAVRLDLEDSSYRASMKKQLKIRKDTETLDKEFVGDISADIRDLSRNVSHLREAGKTTGNAQRVLLSLYFTGIKARRNKIPDAHAETFSWIFQRHFPDSHQPIKFVDWLRCSNGIFWVQGKPGSGKSTLMKFLSDHDNVRLHLNSWTEDHELVVASFFFWHAGSPLQKSQKGLLRSLLFEILRRYPDLVPRVCALRSDLEIDWDDDWSWECDELLYVCHKLIEECSNTRFCFFIDGLDEYEEDQMNISDLVKSIQSLASFPNLKLCVSSRPWPFFADVFGKNLDLSLKLEDLTHSDIRRYVSDKFEKRCQLVNIVDIPDMRLIVSKLVEEVCRRAKGVFLWVYLVVRDLLDGFTGADPIKLLMARLERFPGDLEGFFQHMIDTIPSIYLHSTAQMFEIAKSASGPQSVIAFSFLNEIEAEPKFAIQLPVEAMPELEIVRREEQVRRQLNEQTRGLLEIASDGGSQHRYFQPRVDFLHRTVREFLIQSGGLGPSLHQHLSNTNTALIMCSAILATLKRSPNTEFEDRSVVEQLFQHLFDWAAVAQKSPGTSSELIKILKTVELTCFLQKRHVNFLGLACEGNIVPYIRERVKDNYIRDIINADRPLLDFALNGAQGIIDLDIIKILLENGADPNQTYSSSTIWIRFISRIGDKKDETNNENIKAVIKSLVNSGADLQGKCEMTNNEPISEGYDMSSVMRRQNCLYGDRAWKFYGLKVQKEPSLEIVKAWFTEDEYTALLRGSKTAKSGGFKSRLISRNLLPSLRLT